MKFLLATLFIFFLAVSATLAGQPEAREMARLNNCLPKKIEVYDNQLGTVGKTIYQVTCNLPKTANKDAGDAASTPDAVLISCDQSLCEFMRPLKLQAK